MNSGIEIGADNEVQRGGGLGEMVKDPHLGDAAIDSDEIQLP